MLDVPGIRILPANARQIRPGALGTPLERMVVHRFRREAVVAIAFDLVAERTDHLAVAQVAPLADIDIATGLLERGVGTNPLHLLDGVIEPEQWRDFDDTPEDHRHEGEDPQQGDVAFQLLMASQKTFLLGAHDFRPYSAGTSG